MGLAEFDADFGEKKSPGLAAFDADFGGAAPKPATRNVLTRGYQDYVAKPVTKAVSGVADLATEPAVIVSRLLQGEPVGQVARSYNPLDAGARADINARSERETNPLAEVIVPQTPLEAGMMVGTMGAGAAASKLPSAVARLAGANPALTRILAGTAGGAGGGGAMDPSVSGVTTGAATGALATGAGEGLGKLLPWLWRAGGGKAKEAARDAAEYGRVLGEASPPLKGATTVQDLHELAAGRGQKLLGAAKDQVNREIGDFADARIEVPSLGVTERVIEPIKGYAAGTHAVTRTKPMTLQEANDALSEIGAKAFSQNVMDRNFNGIDQRRLYGQVRREIVESLERLDPTGYAPAAWNKIQQQYERGLAGLEPIQTKAAYRPGKTSAKAQFNTPYVQDYFRDPKNLADLRDRFGDENIQALINAITGGGGALSRDILTPGRGGTMDALAQTYGRGQGGAPQTIGSLLRTLLPDIGSSYAGTRGKGPTLPPMLQQILNVGMQRGATRSE